jgi:hypothetical protein
VRISKPCILAASAVLLAGLILGHLVVPVALTRRIELSLVAFGNDGPCLVEWGSSDPDHPPNGFYIDLNAGERAGSVTKTTLSRPLPAYAAGPLRITLPQERFGRVIIEDARLVTRLLGLAVRVEPCKAIPGDSGESGGFAETSVELPLRRLPVLHAWLVRLASALGLLALAGLARLLLRIASFWNTRSAGFDPADSRHTLSPGRPIAGSCSPSRAFMIGAIVLSLAAPFYLALWAPMILFSDSTAYIWLGKLLYENRDLGHLDGWRLPGYALFIAPFVVHTRNYTLYIGLAQAALGAVTSMLVFDMSRRRLAAPWPHVAMLLTALDPFLLVWQRAILSETLASFLAVLCAWIFTRSVIRAQPGETPTAMPPGRYGGTLSLAGLKWVFSFSALGILCGLASLSRGNLQILPLIFAAALLVEGLLARRLPYAVASVSVLLLSFTLTIWPVLSYNARVFGERSLVVGAPAGRTVFAWLNTDIDFNQTRSLSFEQYRDLQRRVDRLEINEWQFTGEMERNERIPVPPRTHPWVARSIRANVILRESIARDPRRYVHRLIQATLAHLGVPIREPWYMSNLARAQAAILLGRPSDEKSNFYDDLSRFPDSIRPTFERVIVDCSSVPASPHARALGAWWRLWEFLRPVASLLALAGCLAALVRRDVITLVFGAIFFGNIAAVVLIQFAGETRYSMALDPFLFLTIFHGAFARDRALAPPPLLSWQ